MNEVFLEDRANPLPEYSVIVPFWNARPYLKRCIESLLNQSLPQSAYEVLFVDNNSTDGGSEIVKTHPFLRLLTEPKQGSYVARNRGVAEARGKILVFTDPDCIADTNWLERIGKLMSHPQVGLILGHRTSHGDAIGLSLIAEYEFQKLAFVVQSGIPELQFGHTNNLAVRREIMQVAGPFEELTRGADTVFVRRAIDALGHNIVRCSSEIFVCHLEITSIWSYYKKCLTYGRSNEGVANITMFRPLSSGERWQVFRNAVRALGGSKFRGAMLLGVLIPGVVAYEWTRIAQRLRQAMHYSVKKRKT